MPICEPSGNIGSAAVAGSETAAKTQTTHNAKAGEGFMAAGMRPR